MKIMNILEEIKLAHRKARDRIRVGTLDELRIGEVFEFGTTQELHIGDTIDIHQQYQPVYGHAVVTKDLGYGFYEARRTE